MDNVNITVNETIENIVVNPSVLTDTIDVNITGTTETINVDVTPNLTTININSIAGSPVTNTSQLINDGEDGINPFITLNDIPPVTGYVPYNGATQDVNLGEFGTQLGNIEFDNTPTNIPTGAGSMYWNDADGTTDLILKGGNVTLQVGQEQVLRVVNKTATNVNLLQSNYQAVRVTGAQGQRLKVDLAQATNDVFSAETIGLVTETINNNQEGFITTSGLVRGINTTGSIQGESWADGDILYLSHTTAGNITKVKPIAPNHLVIIGYVVHSHITQGTIFVKVDNGYELDELHNVKITTPLNNNVLSYNSTSNIWENKTVDSVIGYTPGTVSSVGALTLGTTGTDLSSTVANGTTTPVITLNVPTASATNRGALSSTDWTTFNGKFNLPSLTSGSVLFSNGTTIAQDNSNFFWDNTNKRLGIGTASPIANLQVSQTTTGLGTVATNGTITLTGTSTKFTNTFKVGDTITVSGETIRTIATIVSDTSLTVTVAFSTIASALSYTLVGGDRFVVLGNGNVGIGTTSPTYKLDVRGNMFVQNAIGADAVALFGTNGGGFSIEVANRTDIKLKTNAIMTSRGTGITFRTTAGEPVTATLGVVAPGALSTDIALRVRNSADTADLLSLNGLGVTTINAVNENVQLRLTNTGAANNRSAIAFQFNNSGVDQAMVRALPGIIVGQYGRFAISTYNVFGGGMVDRMLFDEFGGVSIGASYAQNVAIPARLDVRAQGALSTDIALRVRNSADTGDLMVVNGLGNVNLGAGTLTARLNVTGIFDDLPLKVLRQATYGEIIRIGRNGVSETASINYPNDGVFAINTVSLERMRINSGGNVLINTTTDQGGILQVKAPGALSTDIALRVRNSADTADILTVGGTGILYMDPTNANGKIQFATGTGISNTAGVGLNIGQVFAAGGAGYDIKFWDNNFTNNYAKFTSSNICFSSTTITAIEASSQFQINSTTKGFLPPRMTTTQRDAIATPATGLQVFNTTLGTYDIYNGTSWNRFGSQTLIRAAGALSTDIALRVRNSADTGDLMSMNGAGTTLLQNNGVVSLNINDSSNSNVPTINMQQGGSSKVTFECGVGLANRLDIKLGGSRTVTMGAGGVFGVSIGRTYAGITPPTDGLIIEGNTLIGTTTDIASSKLTVESTTKGFLPPRMTNAQRIAIATPAVGLCVYCTDTTEGLYINKSTGWTYIG